MPREMSNDRDREGPKGRGGKGGRAGRDGKERGKDRGKERLIFKKSRCKFCLNKAEKIDYLDYQNLRRLTTERGKILPSRITGACAKHQRQIARAIKRARQAAFLPYVAE
jgi:small subunit ribosomal protein S18